MEKEPIAYLCEIIGALLISFGFLYVIFSESWLVGVVVILGFIIALVGSIIESTCKKKRINNE